MQLSDEFNGNYSTWPLASGVLEVRTVTAGGSIYLVYDFNARVMSARGSLGNGGFSVTPFSQLDADSLHYMRERLVKQGGSPPALPRETPQSPGPKF